MANYERLPVKVYRWDDAEAPKLDKSANCVQLILKACLVTGYGTKQAAGWTMPFEDTSTGVKVFRPKFGAEQDFYVRTSGDTGTLLYMQVYTKMSDINTGELKLQCSTPFKYGVTPCTGRWVVIATERGFWFFNETDAGGSGDIKRSGAYVYCGDTAINSQGLRGVYLKHTGGTGNYNNDSRYPLLYGENSTSVVTAGMLFNPATNTVATVNPFSMFNGLSNMTNNTMASPIYVNAFGELWRLPAFSPSRNDRFNYDILNAELTFINHTTSTYTNADNVLVPIDIWEL